MTREPLRRYILLNCSIEEITNFGMDVFTDPTVHTCIVIISADKNLGQDIVKIRKQVNDLSELQAGYDFEIIQTELGDNENATFDIFIDPTTKDIFEKLHSKSTNLGDLCFIRQCIKTGNDSDLVRVFEGLNKNPEEPWKPTLRGRSINRYNTLVHNEYVKYGPWLARNWKNKSFYETPKIVVRETGRRIIATLDNENRYVLSSLYAIYPKNENERLSLKYFLGIINSSLATFVVKVLALNLTEGAFTKIRTNQLGRLPICTIDFNDPTDTARHAHMVGLVERMLGLHEQLGRVKTPNERVRLERQIEATDKQIDGLVYELYGLTEEEVRVVEGKE